MGVMGLEFYVADLADGTLRVSYFDENDEPQNLHGVARTHGTPMLPFVKAIMDAVPGVTSDREGLLFRSVDDAKEACAAANGLAKEREG